MSFTLSSQYQPIPHLASPLKGEELSSFPFRGKVRMGVGSMGVNSMGVG